MIKDIKTTHQTIDKVKLKLPANKPKSSNFLYRLLFGSAMLCLYLYITSKNNFFIVIISLSLSIGMMYELISITKKHDKPYSINKFLVFLIASIIFLQRALPALALFYPKIPILIHLSHLKPLLFTFYAICLISTVAQLRIKPLKSQLLLLMAVHTTSYLSGLIFSFSIQNINHGKFFYVYPSLLIISNDIFAYFIGKTFGKTPLFSLSPNKTLEGFIGGFVFTFLIGNLLSYLKINSQFFYDPSHKHLELPASINIQWLNFPIMYVHNLAFVFAASFLAPFCGFIASAIKRSFQKKDFGSLIPGHGGLTDRFDCQILMVFFTHYYLRVFSNQNNSSATLIYKFLADNLTDDDLKELCKILTRPS